MGEEVFNIALKFRHVNGMSTIKGDFAFLFPAEYGTGVGTVEQQRYGWISYQVSVRGDDRWKAAEVVRKMVRKVYDQWLLVPHLPAEEKMTEIHLDPGIGNETFPWGSVREIVCNVCQATTKAETTLAGHTWMLAHPDDHTEAERDKVGDGVQHYRLNVSS